MDYCICGNGTGLFLLGLSLEKLFQLCSLVCDGTLFAFGSMKSHLQTHFQCSDMEILMVGSVPCGVCSLVGRFILSKHWQSMLLFLSARSDCFRSC